MVHITLFIVIASFAFDLLQSVLNYQHRDQPIPENVSDVYDTDSYKKWLDYTMENFRVDIYSKVVNVVMVILFIVLSLFSKLGQVSMSISTHKVLEPIIYLALYLTIAYIISIGFDIYKTFHIEEKYGFNKTTVKIFITDQLKNILLTCVLGFGLLYFTISMYHRFGNIALLMAWGAFMVVFLLIFLLYGSVFIKWFNKLTPLPEGSLLTKVTELSNELGYEIKKVSVMDASKRSSKLNAFFSGFGRFKSIVLFDTLIDKCEDDEIVSVLAHEIGHARHKDTLKNMIITGGQVGLYMFLLTFFISNPMISEAFGFSGAHIGFGILIFGIFLGPVSTLLGIPDSYLSRKAEYKADALAAKSGYGDALIGALKVLSRENFSNLTPHPFLVMMTYSHPPTTLRIEALSKLNK